MTTKIDKKITGYKVLADKEPLEVQVTKDFLNEELERPELLLGSTYKIKTPDSDHALYITINDIILNEGTEHEERRPYEIFINSKNMEHFQWVTALTRVVSACFRKGGEYKFIIDQFKQVFDPKGGYFKKSKFVPSLVAEIGGAIDQHVISICGKKELDTNAKEHIESKKKELGIEGNNFPEYATVCGKCGEKSVVLMDGCQTCLSCSDSKCG